MRMAFIHEIQIESSNFPGAPGYTNLYFATDVLSDGASQFNAARAFLVSLAELFPTSWSGRIVPSGRVLEETSGALGRFTTAAAGITPPVPGGSAGGYGAGVAGLVIGWSTVTINRGRLVRGRTFAVPCAAVVYEADGTIAPNTQAFATAAGQTLIDANVQFGVWSRPRLGVGGKHAVATSVRVNDKAAFLTSRRD